MSVKPVNPEYKLFFERTKLYLVMLAGNQCATGTITYSKTELLDQMTENYLKFLAEAKPIDLCEKLDITQTISVEDWDEAKKALKKWAEEDVPSTRVSVKMIILMTM